MKEENLGEGAYEKAEAAGEERMKEEKRGSGERALRGGRKLKMSP